MATKKDTPQEGTAKNEGIDADRIYILLDKARAATDVLAMLALADGIDTLKDTSLCVALNAIEDQINQAMQLVMGKEVAHG